MSITAASLIATVSLVGADQAATQLLGVGTSADLAQTSLLTTSSAAGALSPFLDALGTQAFTTGVGFNGMADASSRATMTLADISAIADTDTVSLSGLAAAADADEVAFAGATAAFDASAVSLNATSAAANKATASSLKSVEGFDLMGAAATGAQGALGILGKAFDALKIGAEVFAVGVAASTFLAGKFQVEMTKLQTTAGELHSNLKMVGSGILDMAGQVGIGALKLGDAMYWIESGGAHGAAALTDLKIAAEGAKAEGSNLDDVAKALMGTLNAFKGTGLSAATAMNVLINSTANGMMTLQDLSNAMSNVSPVAAKFGISVIDIGAGLATMTAQGDNAESAATHLRQIILALEAPASAGAKALKSIGLTTQEVSNAMRKSLPDAIEMITTDLGKKFPEGSAAYNEALKNIAGGNKQLLALLETSGASMKTYKDNVKNISDAVRQGGKDVAGWAEVQANFNTIMDEAGAAVESLFIKIGTALLPALSQLFKNVTPTISAFSQWIDKSGVLSSITQTLSGWVGKLGEAFNYVADAFNQVFNPVKQVTQAFQQIYGPVDKLIPSMKHITDILTPIPDTFGFIVSTAKPLINTLTPLHDSLDKVTSAAKPLADTFDRANGIIKSTSGTVRDAPNVWLPFWTFVKNVITDVKRIDWGGIGAGLERIRVAISQMDWGKVGAFFSGIATSISKVDWGKVGKSIEDIAIGLTKVDWGKVSKSFADFVGAAISVDWKKLASDIGTLMKNLSQVDWKAVIQGFTDVINGIKGVVQFFTFFENALIFVANFTDIMVKKIVGFFQWLFDKLVGHSIIPDLINAIVRWFASLSGRLAGVITGLVNSIVSWFAQLPGRLGAIIIGLVNSIAGWWAQVPGRLAAFGGSIISSLTSPFQTAANIISGILSTIGGWVGTAERNVGNLISKISQVHIPGFASGIENFGGGLAYVHAGEVLTYLPPGTSVTPASKVSAMGGSAPVIHNHIDVYLDGQRMTGQLMPRIVQSIRDRTGARF